MNKIWTIIKKEYKEAVFKKSFIIMTILTPLIMIALGVIPSLLVMMDSEEATKLHVIDQSGFVYPKLTETLDDTLSDGRLRYQLTNIETSGTSFGQTLTEQKEMVENESVKGLIVIPAEIVDSSMVELFAKNVANINVNQRIRNAIGKIVTDHRIQQSGLDPLVVKKLTRSIHLKTVKIAKGGGESERGFIEEYFSTFIFVLILYLTLILYGTAIMRSIVQEKSTRIIETMLSGVNPFQLMAGKILGQGSVGLTQYMLWAIFGISMILFGGQVMPVSADYFNFSPAIFVYFVIFYILGYFIFAVLYAAVGALTNTDQEAQQLSMPIVMLLIVPLMLIGFLVKNPDSTIAVVLSQIPFFSPIIMFARINLSSPSFYEILSSISILVLTILFLIWLVAKVYRVGILMYGKRPTLPEIIKWLRYQ